MSFLLDVNVLIALVDGAHINHDAAHAWLLPGVRWCTCPLTQNALVRILSQPAYPTVDATMAEVLAALRKLVNHPDHRPITDDVSLVDDTLFDPHLVTTSRQVTDVYLMGLAFRHGLRLATFDRRLAPDAIRGAGPELCEQIPA